MALRNFYIDAAIDGRAGPLTGGPASKDGGISLTLKMRDAGTILDAVQIDGFARPDCQLRLIVSIPGQESIVIETTR